VGPVITRRQAERVAGFATRARQDGAELVHEGPVPDGLDGFYAAPMLFDHVAPESELFREEVFGPVLAVTPVATDAEAIEAAEATRYGLTAAVWCQDIDRALRTGRALKVGQASINGYAPGGGVELPFGGVKDSGYGREKGVAALGEYSRLRTMFIDLAA
jgi:aldehyde dehydrogenase (NAD+)